MTRKELIYDVMMQASKMQLSDDSRWDEYDYIGYYIDIVRGREIRDRYLRGDDVDPTWIQNMGLSLATEIDKSEDRSFPCDCTLGKITIPELVSLPGDRAVNMLYSACRTYQYHRTTQDRFNYIQNSSGILNSEAYYFRINNAIYFHPYKEYVVPFLILEAPKDGYIIQTEIVSSGSLTVGTVYYVDQGNITHNSVNYQAGQTFTAANTTYTGNGIVKYNLEKIAYTDDDVYPADASLIVRIKERIFKEFIEHDLRTSSDTRNDSADQQIMEQNG